MHHLGLGQEGGCGVSTWALCWAVRHATQYHRCIQSEAWQLHHFAEARSRDQVSSGRSHVCCCSSSTTQVTPCRVADGSPALCKPVVRIEFSTLQHCSRQTPRATSVALLEGKSQVTAPAHIDTCSDILQSLEKALACPDKLSICLHSLQYTCESLHRDAYQASRQ
jgi:hypothetical protein